MKYPAYKKYRSSGIDWLGDVPEHWEVKRLKYATSINDETLPETTPPDYELVYVDISSVDRIIGIVNKEPMVFEEAPSRARRIVRDGDTIVSTVRTYLRAIASIEKAEDNLIVSTGFAVIRPKDINSAYLSYALRSPYFVETVVSRSVGVSYPAVNASDLATIKVPLPETKEQLKIAGFLDHQTGRIDALIAKKKQFIAKLWEKRTALVSSAVTKGLNPKAKLKSSGIDWLGDIPEHWGIKKLKFFANFRSGENITSLSMHEGAEYPVFGGNGLRGYTDSFTHDGTYVLVGRQGALCGNIHLVSGKFWASEHAVVTTPFTEYDVRWFSRVLTAMYLNQYSVSAAQPGLSVERVQNLFAPCPPFQEQQDIANYLARDTAKIDDLTNRVEEAINRLREYRSAIISAAVTGKIDVREEK